MPATNLKSSLYLARLHSLKGERLILGNYKRSGCTKVNRIVYLTLNNVFFFKLGLRGIEEKLDIR